MTTWPTLLDPGWPPGTVDWRSAWVTDQAGRAERERIVVNRRSGTVDVVYAHPDAWATAYRAHRAAAHLVGMRMSSRHSRS